MNATHKDAINAYSMLTKIGDKVTGRIAFDLYQLKMCLKPIVEFQAEEEKKLIDKYGGEIKDNGMLEIKDQKKREAFLNQRNETENLPCDINKISIGIDKIPDITMTEIEALSKFVDFA